LSSQVDCLFCEEGSPCVAHAPKEPKQRSRKPSGSSPSASTLPITLNTASSIFDTSLAPAPTRFQDAELRELSEEERILREIVKTLEPILSRRDKATYRHLLEPKRNSYLSKKRQEVLRGLGRG
jgi:hypothetical protein